MGHCAHPAYASICSTCIIRTRIGFRRYPSHSMCRPWEQTPRTHDSVIEKPLSFVTRSDSPQRQKTPRDMVVRGLARFEAGSAWVIRQLPLRLPLRRLPRQPLRLPRPRRQPGQQPGPRRSPPASGWWPSRRGAARRQPRARRRS